MPRRIEYRPTQTFWIICEGQTEKNYFQKLKAVERIGRAKVLVSENHDAIEILKYAISFMRSKDNFQKGDIVCCVFDRDANSNQQLQEAKALADKHKIQITFSNPCFEYWLLIHFHYHPTSCEKEDLYSKLETYINNYSKNDPDLYLKTKDKKSTAVTNAQRIAVFHSGKGTPQISRESNPLTLVHEIIEKLEEFR